MGNKITFHSRVLLSQPLALHFHNSDLGDDVLPMVQRWRARGAGLSLDFDEFQDVFQVPEEPLSQFQLLDSNGDERVDAHEVLVAAILLSQGHVRSKAEAVFSLFDFSGRTGPGGILNFDEAMLILEACSVGPLKVCEFDFQILRDEVYFYCRSLFDMHRVSTSGVINDRQFKEWALADPSPRAFLQLFQTAQGLSEIHEEVQRAFEEQDAVFSKLADGQDIVSVGELKKAAGLRLAFHAEAEAEVAAVVDLMAVASGGSSPPSGSSVTRERFHMVLQPWNIFNALDLDGTGTLDEKDIQALLWVLGQQKPTPESVNALSVLVGAYTDGDINRLTWLEAVMSQHDGRQPHFQPRYDYRRKPRALVTSVLAAAAVGELKN